MKAISVKQPWASLIVSGVKDIENRSWKCPEKYIGQRVLIHASAIPVVKHSKIVFDRHPLDCLSKEQKLSLEDRNKCYGDGLNQFKLYELAAIIGSVEIIDCVVNHSSIWAEKKISEPKREEFLYTHCVPNGIDSFDGDSYDVAMEDYKKAKPIYNWVLAHPRLFPEPIPAKGNQGFWNYPNILAEPEEEDGELFCHCQRK